jgi:hypothetical protein
MVIVQSDADLLEMIAALHAAGGFAGRLDGGEKQRHENPDDGNDHQKFHECKSVSFHTWLLKK